MIGSALDPQLVSHGRGDTRDDAYGDAASLQYRPLLDMKLDIAMKAGFGQDAAF
jgi:hypothetical protein